MYFDYRFLSLDFLTFHLLEHLRSQMAGYSHISIVVVDIDAANVFSLKSATFAEEADNVAPGDLVLLALTDIDRDHRRKRRSFTSMVRETVVLDIRIDIFRQEFFGT